jgi:predicted RNase H-like HicB family nuclease
MAKRKKKKQPWQKPIYRLWKEKGEWNCAYRDLVGKSWSVGKTPEEALAKGREQAKAYKAFCRHLNGTCNAETCHECKTSKIKRGAMASSRAVTE